MRCVDCAYYYAECDPNTGKSITLPTCHYVYNDGYAPCEVSETKN